ncbi:phospholipase D-like domain-containing protein [Glycomyces niveus]|uniref:Phospholipase D family protein n=1 Tax=Glycomyces niveus TaxID=2820287 RepID=A0ABS3U9L9_9ACTN|nr:phospholipase D-like domain-containing protein [Glycomyces sp. NEAU-S30]MBO3735479.1 phospholipase D family protein [Glycomyces sp. NEAU-S30]
MEEIFDTSALRVPGNYFIVRADRPERTPFEGPAESAFDDYRHSHTYVAGGSTTRDDLLGLIEDAREEVLVVSYLIGDETLSRALENAAARLEGRVRVLVDLKGRRLGDDPFEAAQRRRFEKLAACGVAIRSYPGCHAKFAIIDDRSALVHSANFMSRAFDVTGENGVVIQDPAALADVARFFQRVWRGALWEMDSTGAGATVLRSPETVQFPTGPGTLTRPVPGLIWTFHEEHFILDTVIELIDSAERELLLATFNLSGMSARPDLLHDRLRRAIARGVTVNLLLRAQSGSEAGHEAATLQDFGVNLYPCSLNHAKGIVADRRRGALFSANLDARYGLERDVELGIRLDGTSALGDVVRFFEHSMIEHDRVLVRDPDSLTLSEGWNLGPWPLAGQVEITARTSEWASFCETESGPVLFESGQDDLLLFAGERAWRLRRGSGHPGHLLDRASDEDCDAMRRLSALRPNDAGIGICTAVFHRGSQ